jgi:NADH-quinone oxidoreductase subunit A
MTPISIVAYLLVFAAAGFLVVFAALLIGSLLRPRAPRPEKLATYECGEPTIGPGFVQFDLRFYVVALVFLVFEVEVGFFFPWATVFGKATQLADPKMAKVVSAERAAQTGEPVGALTTEAEDIVKHLGVKIPGAPDPAAAPETNALAIEGSARRLARMAMADIAVFFGVLLVGFAYVWKRGDLNWVRAVEQPSGGRVEGPGRSAVGPAKE